MKEYEQRATKMIMSTVEGVKAQIRKAYNKGYKDGRADTPFTDTEEAEKKAYDKGLNDAWELVKRIESTPEDGGLTNEQIVEVFGQYWSSFELYRAFSVEEAMDLMKAYEDKKQDSEIKVGDEVRGGVVLNKAIVVKVKNESISVLWEDGSVSREYKDDWTKTGRHFPQIAEVLAELRGAENDE